MPVAVSVATRSGLSATAIAALGRAAEAADVDAFYLAESTADSFTLCQAALATTTSIVVGTAVANARLRHPAAAAMAGATLSEWSGGRFRVGLGVSNPHLNETVLGMAPIRPVGFMREYVAAMRRVLGATPADRPVDLDRPAANPNLPISLAALQPRMLRLAGEIADGVVLSLTTPATLAAALNEIAAGAEAAGRTRGDLTIECVLPCCFDGDEAGRHAGRGVVVGYARHPGAARLFGERGFADQLPKIVAALDRDDVEAAYRLVDDEIVDEFVLVGDLDRCAARIADYLRAGIDLPILFPVSGHGDWEDTVRRVIDVATDLLPTADIRKVLT